MSLPLHMPLKGSHLIEASAGTGKTWTIAALYLRLVLGHGEADTAPPRALMPGEILVMTFTRAATRELSDRIRERLAQAARCFRGEPGTEGLVAGDALLQALWAAFPEGPARERAAHRLALAAEAMDDAAVHTIDAWCQRMLREHAFDSGNLFDEELVADEGALLEEAVNDFWRAEVYPLREAALDAVLEVWPAPQALRREVAGLLARLDALPAAPVSDVEALIHGRVARLNALRAGWLPRAQALRAWLEDTLGRKDNPFNGNRLRKTSVASWMERLVQWTRQEGGEALQFTEKAADHAKVAHRLSRVGLHEVLKEGRSVDLPPECADLEHLLDALEDLGALGAALRQHAARQVAVRLQGLKLRAGRYGFSDLQARLEAALSGPRADALRQRIVAQYPVALIDEFQDTSPLQYRLFDRLYRIAENRPDTGLFLIGDPKQSIYGFRGADIYSYLKARHDTQGRHHVLDTNFRSTQAVVEAVNQLFGRAERARPTGAFDLPKNGPLALPFEPVGARGRRERLVCGEGGVPALDIAVDDGPLPAEGLRKVWAARCAEKIVGWLNDPACGLQEDGQPLQRLSPGDIAVLVRSRHEADAVRQALAARKVASVYLSDQESVFASPEAVELLRWLRAVADPGDARLARAAHAGAAMGLTLEDLRRCSTDDEAWDVHLVRLRELQGIWQRQGVLAMLRRTLHDLRLPARWLAEPGGERVLTNVLHLSELLQQASVQLEGEASLVRWLGEQIRDHLAGLGEGGEDRIVRLESDAALVQIVTVHKSKGLEYPVVCLPFAASTRQVERRLRSWVEVVQADGGRRLDFDLDEASLDGADRERLREDLRLLYVALTRARHALWLGVGLAGGRGVAGSETTSFSASALGHLLGLSGDKVEVSVCRQAWAALWQDSGAISRAEVGAPARTRLMSRGAPPALQGAAPFDARIERDWTIGSFSALVRDLPPGGATRSAEVLERTDPFDPVPDPALDLGEAESPVLNDPLREEAWREEQAAAAAGDRGPPSVVDSGDTAPWHRYPKGPLAGNFLHEQLERLAGPHGWEALHTPEFQRGLVRRCERQGPNYDAEGMSQWLEALVGTPLPGPDVPLSACLNRLVEMEFWMPGAGRPVQDLDRLCRTWILPGAERPVLPQRSLRGLVMGFADLVFEHQGRYWVLDYKSNALGPDDAAYTPEALQDALLHHRYDLQAALYLLALHRLLRSRLGEAYDPARQVGGALYLFARGIAAPTRGCLMLPAPAELLEALDVLLQSDPGVSADGAAGVAGECPA